MGSGSAGGNYKQPCAKTSSRRGTARTAITVTTRTAPPSFVPKSRACQGWVLPECLWHQEWVRWPKICSRGRGMSSKLFFALTILLMVSVNLAKIATLHMAPKSWPRAKSKGFKKKKNCWIKKNARFFILKKKKDNISIKSLTETD